MELDNTTVRGAYGVLLLLIVIAALLGYAVVALAIWNRKDLQQKNIWLTSLATSDVMMLIHMLVIVMSTIQSTWPFGKFGCQVNAWMGLASGFISIASITWIAIDRYYQQCQPDMCGKNYNFFMILVWSLGAVAASLPAFGFGAYEVAHEHTAGCLVDLNQHDSKMQAYIMLVAAVWFVYPLTKIFRYYNKLSIESKQQQMLSKIVPALFLVCYCPYAMYASLKVTVGVGVLPVWMVAVIYLLPKIIPALNPYIYMQSDPELLSACQEVIHWRRQEAVKQQ
uniref:CiNut G-protein coupled receptor like protein n=1 Tax=Phallusia mammillata TaxID=59560 RepID=A0A6F9DQ23_9ASCI|nr:CiNut G-protein coupled receptor like protein [Phallusia mammillata]